MRANGFVKAVAIVICMALPGKSLIARDEGIREENGPECTILEGVYENVGVQVSGADRGSIAPPLFSRDVLKNWKQGVSPDLFSMRVAPGRRVIFSFIGSAGAEVDRFESGMVCAEDRLTLERKGAARGEGFSGEYHSQLTFGVSTGGHQVLIKQIEQIEGRDFFIFPRSEKREREFRFERKN